MGDECDKVYSYFFGTFSVYLFSFLNSKASQSIPFIKREAFFLANSIAKPLLLKGRFKEEQFTVKNYNECKKK